MRNSILLLILATLAGSGCSGSSRTGTLDTAKDDALAQVGEMVRFYQMSQNKPPAKFADFASIRAVSGNGYSALQSGEVVLRYGASLTDLSEEPGQSKSEEILAYQKEVPESGGKVILLDRSIRPMTPEEFKSAKKAGKD